MINHTHVVGQFKIESGSVLATDPCYSLDVKCMGRLEGVKIGSWTAVTELEQVKHGRNVNITAFHSSIPLTKVDRLNWSLTNSAIGVDSGQAGFFDLNKYADPNSVTGYQPNNVETFNRAKSYNDSEDFYAACCDATLGPSGEGVRVNGFVGAGCIPYGVISSSGYGDGSYDLYTATDDNGDVVGMSIVFIPDEEPCENCGDRDCHGYCSYDEEEMD